MVLTEVEKRMEDGRGLVCPRERINRILEDRFYGKKPRVDIQRAVHFTESMRDTESEPQVIRVAKAVAHAMDCCETVIQDHELIVGTAGGSGRYCMLYPETRGGQFAMDLPNILKSQGQGGYIMSEDAVETVLNEVVPYWKGKTAHEYYLSLLPEDTRKVIYGDSMYATAGLIHDEANNSHTLNWTGEYRRVIQCGLRSVIDEAENKIAAIEEDLYHNQFDKTYFLRAVIIVCEALIRYANRYADQAQKMAEQEDDPTRKAELMRIAENCRQVPEHPARDFYEGIQSQWFVQLGYRFEAMNSGGIGLNRLDQYMYPLYQKGLDDGSLTEETALEILECLFIKIGEVIQYQGKSTGGVWEGYTHFEALTVGGQTVDGQDATNGLSYLLLRSKQEFPFQYPDVGVRLHANTPEKFLMEAAKVVQMGYGFPKFFNDEEVIPQYLNLGVPVEIARDYCQSGCLSARLSRYETYLPTGANINITAVLDMALNDGYVHYGEGRHEKFVDMPFGADEITNMDELMQNLEAAFTFFIRHNMKRTGALEMSNSVKMACPFASAMSEACMINMKDMHQPNVDGYGLYADNGATSIIGVGTTTEAMAAIDQYVFTDHILTLKDIREAVDADYVGFERIQELLKNGPKFGNGDERSIEIARIFDAMLQKVVKRYRTMYGERRLKFTPVASHVALGGKTRATANGRNAGAPLSEGISPTQGTDTEGPVTTLTAVARTNSRTCNNTMQRLLNLKLSPQTAAGEEGNRHIRQLLRTFVDLKLWHIQINVVNKETLLAAQKEPEKYRNLIVRVAGYCAYFVDLSSKLQGEIIARTEHEEV